MHVADGVVTFLFDAAVVTATKTGVSVVAGPEHARLDLPAHDLDVALRLAHARSLSR